MSDLVQRLAQGRHPAHISIRPERTVAAFRDCLGRGFVHVRFTNTRGGTELGFSIDQSRSELTTADLDGGTGRVRLVGELSLDYVPVRCVADIDLPSLEGVAHLEVLEQSAEVQPAVE
ncbi:MAG: MbtH domain protein [Cyanobacteria bacterium]|nr:MbtH domain protein [Cyanobacteriota bacterium]